jgi:hypothetical protein
MACAHAFHGCASWRRSRNRDINDRVAHRRAHETDGSTIDAYARGGWHGVLLRAGLHQQVTRISFRAASSSQNLQQRTQRAPTPVLCLTARWYNIARFCRSASARRRWRHRGVANAGDALPALQLLALNAGMPYPPRLRCAVYLYAAVTKRFLLRLPRTRVTLGE